MPKFIIPGRLPGLNEMIDVARENKYKAAAMKKEYTEMAGWCAKAARLPKMERVNVLVTWCEPNRMRDKDNIHAGIKFILDGLVLAGVIENDGWKQIGDIDHRFAVDRRNPRVEVELIKASTF